jgi:hypothetical protein
MTKAEREWVTTVKRLGCLCCIARGYEHDPDGSVVDAHHLLSGGIRRGHLHTVGLCKWHHSGRLIVAGWNHGTHRRLLGPALSEGSVPFHAVFGDDESLMQQQHALIAKNTRRAA